MENVITESPEKSGSPAVPHHHGIKVTKSCTIHSSPEKLYSFWRRFENLPLFMKSLVSVTETGETSHWVAKGPGGKKIKWDAILIKDAANEMISWRTVEGSDVAHAGSVHFKAAPGDRGTEVRVKFEYEAPGGKLASKLAKITGKEPSQQVEKDLSHFKAFIEAGEIPTTQGQPKGEK